MRSKFSLAIAAAMVFITTACTPTPPPVEPKIVVRPLKEDLNEGRLNDYEQFSRCAGLYRFISWSTSGEAARLRPELMNVTVVNAQASRHAQTLAALELIDADSQKEEVANLANRTAERNSEAYFKGYLVFVSIYAAAREKAGETVDTPAILKQDAKSCRSILSKGTKNRAR